MKSQLSQLKPLGLPLAVAVAVLCSFAPTQVFAQSRVSKSKINKPAQAPVIRSYAPNAKKPAIAVSSKNVGSKWTST
ncbi:MAG TPA: hypothetical protein VFH43_01320, partial [Candidatus Kapabacteria bacterium]|nr:hypothetical protein [Candidatus Kapabacteria bacterium]